MTNKLCHLARSVWRFYRDGFASMTVGRTLWLVIAVKLAIIFLVLRLFLMPDVLSRDAPGGDKAAYVAGQLTRGVVSRSR